MKDAALLAFKQGRTLLTEWRDCTLRMFPERHDFLAKLSNPEDLCVSKFRHGAGVLTDGCDTARKFWRNFIAAVKEVYTAKGYSGDEVKMFEFDCWQHMQNIWFSTVIKHLSKYLKEIISDNMSEFLSILRSTTEIEDLLRCIKNQLGATSQYAKGCESCSLSG